MINLCIDENCEWINALRNKLMKPEYYDNDCNEYTSEIVLNSSNVCGNMTIQNDKLTLLSEISDKALKGDLSTILAFYQEQLIESGQLKAVLTMLLNGRRSVCVTTFGRSVSSWDLPRVMYVTIYVRCDKLFVIGHTHSLEITEGVELDFACLKAVGQYMLQNLNVGDVDISMLIDQAYAR